MSRSPSPTNHLLFLSTMLFLFLLATPFAAADSLDVYCASKSSVDGCIRDIAIKKQDVTLCDRITSDSVKNSCLSKLAVILNDITLCRSIKKLHESSEDRAECYMEFVESPEDISICQEYITVNEFFDECIDHALDSEVSLDTCYLYKSPLKSIRCIKKTAKKLKDYKICEHIYEFQPERTSCTRIATASAACEDELNTDEHYEACREPFYEEIYGIKNQCKEWDVQAETTLREKESTTINFPGEEGIRNRVGLTLLFVDLPSQTMTVRINQRQDALAFEEVPLGYSVNLSEVYVQPIKVWDDVVEGDTTNKRYNFAKLCVYRKEKQDEEQDEENDDINENDDTDEEDGTGNDLEENTGDEAPEEEQPEEPSEPDNSSDSPVDDGDAIEEPKQPNFFIRLLRWLTSFGT